MGAFLYNLYIMFNHNEIEKKWQKIWLETNAFKTTNKSDKKFYALDMFPYPSGAGLHVGHPEGYTATDIIARYKRLNGFDVLHPIGWDAFGLPAEQYALKTGNHPKGFTQENISRFREQLQSLGFSYDYSKEVDTTDPAYYKTTQWIFNQIYKKGLTEIREIEVNWCEVLGTGLANEEVITLANGDKVSEVGSFPVVKKPMRQWVMKITEYADRLFDDLDTIPWPNSLKSLQKNWIKNEDGSMHLQDWVFSRQRYWGEPFPVAFEESTGEILLVEELPVLLPELKEIKPSGTGESPLALAKEWLHFEKDGKQYRRETNTMPQWAGSCWYYLGYILKQEDGTYLDIESPEAKKAFEKWLPVDLYIGGQEHAVLHLLYARFWHKILFDLGVVPTAEPFFKIVNQGMILGTDGQKMSKSKGNVINPDDIVKEFGGDTLRLYEMFMGPFEETKPWNEEGVKGVRRFLDRVVRAFTEVAIIGDSKVDSEYNSFVRDVTKDIEELKFNTGISKMMVFINAIYKTPEISKEQIKGFLTILSTYAPHIAEELLEKFGFAQVKDLSWPTYDESKIKASDIEVAVQVNGKLRATLSIQGTESQEEVISKAKSLENVVKYLEGVVVVKEIYIKNKIVNIVVK